ncbi:HAD-IA family hydrolase [Fructilactobacillus cliffordii]|uniref:HAD-IA family hydrolase n=1 Tax=Fructilactobacillus cliffordii TaxID=2940299 RepID=A0A9Q9E375_9LACO|nr:HAD-IA family hydrolase [Fructilactobacillus cliffordii]USS89584.1 HAD-IA family hydrolase [Fructilactobacillus cliffordii]
MTNLIWDFDGTLFDTYPYMVSAFTKALQQNGIDEVEIDGDEIYQQMRVHSLNSAITKFSARFHLDSERLLADYRRFEALEIQLSQPFAGGPTILQAVTANGGQNGLLTHRDEQAIALLEQFKLKSLFTGFVTSQQGFARKPDPASLLFLIKQQHLNPTETFMVGDRKLDVEAAHNAGIKSVLFDPDYLLEATGNPTVTIHSLAELQQLL